MSALTRTSPRMPCAAPMRATSVDRGLADGRSLFADDGTFECLTNEPLIGDALLFGTLPDSIKEGADEVTLKIDDNAKIRVLKSTIVRIVPKDTKEGA